MACKVPASLEDTADSSDPGQEGPQFSQIPSEPHAGASMSQTALEI